MKILLVCAAGMSTGLLVKKMENYWKENGQAHSINAVGLGEYQDVCKNYDIIMVGPQVSYRLKEVKELSGMPCDAIPSYEYAVGNCANIMKLAEKLFSQK